MGHKHSAKRPRIGEMDRIDAGMVRKVATSFQQQACLHLGSGSIKFELIWNKRTAGLFGSVSAAIANQRRLSIKKPGPWQPEAQAETDDRGQTQGWIMYLACPKCSRRCRVLYSKPNLCEFGCVKCNRPAYASNSWPYTGRKNAGGISKHERNRLKHEQAVKRIKKQLGETQQSWPHPCCTSTKKGDKKPTRMSNARFDELSMKLDIEEKMALLASMKILAYSYRWQRLLLQLQ